MISEREHQAPPDDAGWGPEQRGFAADSALYYQGDRAGGLYLLRRGMVKLVRHLPNGRARIVGLHGAGAVIGLPSSLDGSAQANPHSAIALTPIECEVYPAPLLSRLRRADAQRYLQLLEGVQEQLRQADFWLCELSTGPIRSRVACLIGFLEGMNRDLPAGEVNLLTCQEMGEMLGVTPESVSRTVAEMKRERLLSPVPGTGARPGHRFCCDTQQLEQVARG